MGEGFRVQGSGFRVHVSGFKVWGSGMYQEDELEVLRHRAQHHPCDEHEHHGLRAPGRHLWRGPGFRISGSKYRVAREREGQQESFRFRVLGSVGFRVWSSGFRVQGLGFRV